MADNTALNAGTGGDTIATDDIAGVKYQRVKLTLGADGVNDGDVASGNALPVSAASLPLPSGAATSAKQDTGNTSLASIDGKITAVNTGAVVVASGSLTANAGTNLNTSALALESGGNLATLAGAVRAEDAASADGHTGVVILAVRKGTPANTSGTDGDYETLQISAGRLWASATIDAALPAGANAIGKLAANSGVTIGAIEVAAAQTLATVTTVSTVTTLSTLTGGAVAHDGADSGNPVKVGAKCSLTLSDDTIVANADRTDLTSDGDGALLVRQQFPLGDLISEAVSNTDGNSTAFSNFGAVASTRSYVTAIHVHRTDAGTSTAYVDFRDGTAGSVLWRMPLPPNGGSVIASAIPLFRTTANTALAFDVSAALTTVYISVSGFKSKV